MGVCSEMNETLVVSTCCFDIVLGKNWYVCVCLHTYNTYHVEAYVTVFIRKSVQHTHIVHNYCSISCLHSPQVTHPCTLL